MFFPKTMELNCYHFCLIKIFCSFVLKQKNQNFKTWNLS